MAASAASARVASPQAQASTGAYVRVVIPPDKRDQVGTTIAPLQMEAQDSTAGAVLTFSAAGLPPGLAISPAGLISGTVSTGGQYSVTVTAADQSGASGSASFTWFVYGTATAVTPALQTVPVGFPVSLQLQATDSVPGQTLTFKQLPLCCTAEPPGLSISPSGLITGSILRLAGGSGYSYLYVSVSDVLGASAYILVSFRALLGPGPGESAPLKTAVAGKCLDDTGSGTANNNPVQLYSCNGDAAQQWQVDGNEIKDFGKCLSNLNGGTADGTRVVLYSCEPSNIRISQSQEWSVQADGELSDANSGLCLWTTRTRAGPTGSSCRCGAAMARSSSAGPCPPGRSPQRSRGCARTTTMRARPTARRLCSGPANGQHSQQWTAMLDGTIRVGGKCLAVANHGTANGSKLELWSCDTSVAPDQVWYTLPDGQIVNAISGRCLDDPAASSKDGTQLQIWDCDEPKQQSWRVP